MKEVNPMVAKRLIVLLMITEFTLGVAGISFAAEEIIRYRFQN